MSVMKEYWNAICCNLDNLAHYVFYSLDYEDEFNKRHVKCEIWSYKPSVNSFQMTKLVISTVIFMGPCGQYFLFQ